jgi:hypothetical protein
MLVGPAVGQHTSVNSLGLPMLGVHAPLSLVIIYSRYAMMYAAACAGMSCCCFGELSGQWLLDLVVMLLLNANPRALHTSCTIPR